MKIKKFENKFKGNIWLKSFSPGIYHKSSRLKIWTLEDW